VSYWIKGLTRSMPQLVCVRAKKVQTNRDGWGEEILPRSTFYLQQRPYMSTMRVPATASEEP
jgi:hypothetical protein